MSQSIVVASILTHHESPFIFGALLCRKRLFSFPARDRSTRGWGRIRPDACLYDWEQDLRRGDNLVLAAFGGGFTWGAAYLKWAYDAPQRIPTSDAQA